MLIVSGRRFLSEDCEGGRILNVKDSFMKLGCGCML